MARRTGQPRFVCEIELQTTAHERRVLRTRLDCSRQLYNAVLGELVCRLDRARASQQWQAARELPKGRERSAAFKALRERFGLTEAEVYRHPSLDRAVWLRRHLDSDTAQNTAREAWRALARHLFGDERGRKAGRPHFRRYGELRSVEGKRAERCVRLVREDKDAYVAWDTDHHELRLRLLADPSDPVHAHALAAECAYVRILRRVVRGRERFYAQLVCKGAPTRKRRRGAAIREPEPAPERPVGLDVGPSRVAVVSEDGEPRLRTLADGLDRKQHARRRYQRRIDRQRRANNPDCFDEQGRAIRGKRPGKRSQRQRANEAKLRELDRRQTAQRRNLHGRLANEIFAQGTTIHAERISYRALQRAFGRSARHRASGLFMRLIAEKAKLVGGTLVEIPTHSTYLSQRCLCGARERKDLSERWHSCLCEHLGGQRVQRDLFSAFLALFCAGEGSFDQEAAQAAWRRWGANCLPRPQSRRAAHRRAPTQKRVRAVRPKSGRSRGEAAPSARKAAGRGRRSTAAPGRSPPALAAGNS